MITNRFADLAAPGSQLARKIQPFCSSVTIVLGIATGGVAAAAVVAKHLKVPFDVVLLRRLLAPDGPQFPICAASVAGTIVMDEGMPARHTIQSSPLDHFLADALNELERRTKQCRGDARPVELSTNDVVLIDNGIHTGSTMISSIRAIRRFSPAKIIVATPVVAPEIKSAVEEMADKLIYLNCPDNFGHVGLWYSALRRISDEQIRIIFEQSNKCGTYQRLQGSEQ